MLHQFLSSSLTLGCYVAMTDDELASKRSMHYVEICLINSYNYDNRNNNDNNDCVLFSCNIYDIVVVVIMI